MMKKIIGLISFFFMLVMILPVGGLRMIESMIFFPEKDFYAVPDDFGLRYENVEIQSGEELLHGWFLPAEASKLCLLLLHGNGGNIAGRIHKAEGWVKRGISVILVDYRGYGKSTGKPTSDEDILADGRAALEFLTSKGYSHEEIILWGESLGSYPAIRLAAETKVKALALEAPYTSFTELAPRHYSFLPQFMLEGALRKFRFDNKSWISKIQAPLFIIHGNRDETCFFEMGRELFGLAPEPKEFFEVDGGDHNSLVEIAGESYWDRPYHFIENRGG